MPKIDRLNGPSRGFELDFVEREATPRSLMKLSIHLHAAGLSLSDTVSVLDGFDVQRCRTTVHNWVRKADLQPEDGKSPNQVAVDETVIRLNDECYWLLAAVDAETNEFLHVRLHPACTIALTERFLRELRQKHDVADTLFIVDGAPWLQAALHRYNLRFQTEHHGNRNAVKRIFREVKRRTFLVSNFFSHLEPSTAENWLQSFDCWHNAPN